MAHPWSDLLPYIDHLGQRKFSTLETLTLVPGYLLLNGDVNLYMDADQPIRELFQGPARVSWSNSTYNWSQTPQWTLFGADHRSPCIR